MSFASFDGRIIVTSRFCAISSIKPSIRFFGEGGEGGGDAGGGIGGLPWDALVLF